MTFTTAMNMTFVYQHSYPAFAYQHSRKTYQRSTNYWIHGIMGYFGILVEPAIHIATRTLAQTIYAIYVTITDQSKVDSIDQHL